MYAGEINNQFGGGEILDHIKMNSAFKEVTDRVDVIEAEPRTVACKVTISNGNPIKGNAQCNSWIGGLVKTTNGQGGTDPGRVEISILGGVFSGNPVCTVTARTNLISADFDTVEPSATGLKVGTNTYDNVNVDSDFYLICVGPK